MGKGTNNFRTCQIINGIPNAPISIDEQVQLIDSLSRFELPEFHSSVLNTIKFYTLKARVEFNLTREQFPMPCLSYKIRGDTAGQAWYAEHKIKINPVYLEFNPHHILHDTIPHEIAHLVTRLIHGFGVAPHGREWENVSSKLGHVHNRCHNMPRVRDVIADKLRGMSEDDF